MGYRIDLVFNMIRVGLFFLDHTLINQHITKAKELMEQVSVFTLIFTFLFFLFSLNGKLLSGYLYNTDRIRYKIKKLRNIELWDLFWYTGSIQELWFRIYCGFTIS